MANHQSVIWGGYGWGNVGDELTLAVAIADLKEQGVKKIGVLTSFPEYTQSLFPEVEVIAFNPVIRRYRFIQLIERISRRFGGPKLPEPSLRPEFQTAAVGNWVSALLDAEQLYLAGGGYFTDLFPIFERFILPVEVAKLLGCKVKSAPLGIGPFHDKRKIRRFVHAFKGVNLCVRDSISSKFCQKHGLKVFVRTDDGFRVGKVLECVVQPAAFNRGVILGVNFFPQHGANDKKAFKQWWLEFLCIAINHGVVVEGFCFHNNLSEDYAALVELFESTGLSSSLVKRPAFDFRDACRDLGHYSMIASSRFHAVVVANVYCVPCIGVSSGGYYDAKMDAACKGSTKAHHARLADDSPSKAFNTLITSHRMRE